VRRDVYYYDARERHGAPLSATANNGKSIGPELGLGFVLGQVLDEPVLVLKSCIGNRSLGWDLLPPGSERYEAEVTERNGQKVTKVFAGYKDSPDSWIKERNRNAATGTRASVRRRSGQREGRARRPREDLSGLPGQGYEIAGFVWWQGHKDQNAVHGRPATRKPRALIASLRKDYDAPTRSSCSPPAAESRPRKLRPADLRSQLAIGLSEKHPNSPAT